MWRNTSTQLKPGGKLVNIRATGRLDEEYAASGKYGIQFGSHLLDKHANLSSDIDYRNGLVDLECLNAEETEVVKEDKAFWADFVKAPCMGVFTARKP